MQIHNAPVTVPELRQLEKPEMVMIFTDKAIDYYKENRKSIDKKGCKMLEWSPENGLRLL